MGGQEARANPTVQLERAEQGRAKRAKNPAPQQRFLSEANEDNSQGNKISERERSPGAAGRCKELWKPTTGRGRESKTLQEDKEDKSLFYGSLGDLALMPHLLYKLNSP